MPGNLACTENGQSDSPEEGYETVEEEPAEWSWSRDKPAEGVWAPTATSTCIVEGTQTLNLGNVWTRL